MSNIARVPISEVLGDRNSSVKVEESWSKDVPVEAGASAQPLQEFDRTKAILAAVAKRKEPRPRPEGFEPHSSLQAVSRQHHFFVLNGKKLTFIGSKEMDASKFQKDVSGRFYREWLKKNFPELNGTVDWADIVSFADNQTLKDVAELMGMVE